MDIETKRIVSTMTFEPNHQWSKSLFVNFNNGFSFLLEAEYSIVNEKVNYANIGLRKYFISSNQKLKGYFSMGYSPVESNQIAGSFAVHI